MSFSFEASVFHGRKTPEPGVIVGYAAIAVKLNLNIPTPKVIALISKKNRQYQKNNWLVLTPKHQPEETLYKQLVFALKYEGVDLLFFKRLFQSQSPNQIQELLQIEPTGQYSRRIWFLYEWLIGEELPLKDADVKIKYTPLLDAKLQYGVQGENSARHRIVNNLPGTRDFCPLIRKTPKLERLTTSELSERKNALINGVHKDVLQRASAFLLLKDSKASFTIEGESPLSKRAARWGKAIGQAGMNALSRKELLRLQQLVIESNRFMKMGFREEGGFVGDHDRSSGEPMPDHISARSENVIQLVDGLIETEQLLLKDQDFDAVMAAATIAFGFVFIHPFVDGNGRIHRYLIHHILARKSFTQQGIIFPVSASILDHIDDYRNVLESYSHPLLELIDWSVTSDNNVEVTNETIDLYRYFDATEQAEFLYDCVIDTVENIIPIEVAYLRNYDVFKKYLDDEFEMPDKVVALLVRFLEQGNGNLSNRAQNKEFKELKESEIAQIESMYQSIFLEG